MRIGGIDSRPEFYGCGAILGVMLFYCKLQHLNRLQRSLWEALFNIFANDIPITLKFDYLCVFSTPLFFNQ